MKRFTSAMLALLMLLVATFVTLPQNAVAATRPAKGVGESVILSVPIYAKNSIARGYGKSGGTGINHTGIDFTAAEGANVFSSCSGTVTVAVTGAKNCDMSAQGTKSYGNYVIVKYNDTYSVLYAHLKNVSVKKGQKVQMGQKIGTVGRTGRVTGVVLHFELRKNGKQIDPQRAMFFTGWVKTDGYWVYLKSGKMVSNAWEKISGKWYHFDANGHMQTGWKKIGGKWYYFESSGAMRTANLKQNGKTYRFNSSGACINP